MLMYLFIFIFLSPFLLMCRPKVRRHITIYTLKKSRNKRTRYLSQGISTAVVIKYSYIFIFFSEKIHTFRGFTNWFVVYCNNFSKKERLQLYARSLGLSVRFIITIYFFIFIYLFVHMRTPYQIYKEEIPDGQIYFFNALPREESLRYRMLAAEEGIVSHLLYLEENAMDVQKYAFSAVHTAAGYLAALVSFFPVVSRCSSDKKTCFNFSILHRLMMLLGNTDIGTAVDFIEQQQANEKLSLQELSAVEAALQELEQKMRQQLKDENKRIEMFRPSVPIPAMKARSSSSCSTVKLDGTESEEQEFVAPSLESSSLNFLMDKSASSTQELPIPKSGRTEAAEDKVGIVVKNDHTPARVVKRARKSSVLDQSDSGIVEEALKGKRMKRQNVEEDSELVEIKKKMTNSGKTAPSSFLESNGTTVATCGRLRSLNPQEKKIATSLQMLLDLLAHVYATKCNELVPLLDFLSQKVKEVKKMVLTVQQQQLACNNQKEFAATSPTSASPEMMAKQQLSTQYPWLDLDFSQTIAAIAASNRTFRADEECQLEFDEDLIHPIAYCLVKELNRLEGFSTAPFQEPSEEEKAKKQAARAAAKQKREEVRRKAEEKARQKEAQAAEQARELAQLRQLLGSAEEDTTQDDALEKTSLGYVHYGALPLGDVRLFEKALFIWCMITSIPKTLQLSKMPFSTFLLGVQEDSEGDNALMREVVQQMLQVGKEQIRSPMWSTRGKTWFAGLVSFVEEMSGNHKKKAREEKMSNSSSSSEDDLDEEEEEEEHVEKATTGEESETTEKEKAKEDTTITLTTPPEKTLEDDLRDTIEEVKALHSRMSWGNASLFHRLTLLQFCVSEILSGEKAREEADAVQRDADDAINAMEKAMREMREDAEKDLKTIWKRVSLAPRKQKKEEAAEENDTERSGDGNKKKGLEAEEIQKILDTVRTKHSTLFLTWMKKQDDELTGCIIDPIGMDRFHRLYWRFPLDRQQIYVQTTGDATSNPPPLIPMPSGFSLTHSPTPELLLDDEETPPLHASLGVDKKQPVEVPQTAWGVIPAHYLETYAESLCIAGNHEGPLRRTLLALAPHLQKSSHAFSSIRTRARSQMFGYTNALNATSFFW